MGGISPRVSEFVLDLLGGDQAEDGVGDGLGGSEGGDRRPSIEFGISVDEEPGVLGPISVDDGVGIVDPESVPEFFEIVVSSGREDPVRRKSQGLSVFGEALRTVSFWIEGHGENDDRLTASSEEVSSLDQVLGGLGSHPVALGVEEADQERFVGFERVVQGEPTTFLVDERGIGKPFAGRMGRDP